MLRRANVLVALAIAASPVGARADDAAEVVVRGGKGARSADVAGSLGAAEVRQLPGAFGDPWRALEVTPGFTPVVSGLPYFYVRGAPPGNVGYSFDGVRVPYLFHFGLGPAIVHPALIARTDVHAGGYPASLGRYAGGFVSATAMPPQDRLHGRAQVRLVDAGAMIEAPFADGRGAAMASARYAYTAALFSLLSADTTIDYRDYQARVSYALTDKDTLSVLAFGAYDFASQRQPVSASTLAAAAGRPDAAGFQGSSVERLLFASELHRLDARWDRATGRGGHLRVAATLGYDRTRVEARRAADDIVTGARFSLEQPVSAAVTLRLGGDATVDRYGGTPLAPFYDDDDVVARQRRIFATHTMFAAGPWLETAITLGDRAVLTPGLRVDVFGSDGFRAVGVDPRLSGRFAVTDGVRIVHAHGIATQPPSLPVALPAITIAHLEGGLQRALQTSAGVEIDLSEDIMLTTTAFRNAFFDLNDALGTAQVELIDLEKSDALLGKSRGVAYGLELGARRKLSRRLTGLVSYTLSRSTRTASGATVPSAYDRPHVASAVASYDLGLGWRAGARYLVYSGVPTAAPAPAYEGQLVGEPPARTPPFHRLDVRVEKRWRVGERGWVAVVLEALNATLSREITGYSCDRAIAFPGRPRPSPGCSERVLGPIAVPSLGVEGGF